MINHDQKSDDGYLGLKILGHEEVLKKVGEISHPEAKVNYVVNNMLTKMLFVCDKQKLLY